MALGVAAAMVGDHRRAQGAADLAALAGASALADGGDPCAAAERVAAENGASLTGCAPAARDVRVTVVVPGPRWLAGYRDLEGQARAGAG
jgi:secretion/DNA translocation related TadE-like protein